MTTRRPDITGVTYRKSSYSGGHNNCVEVGFTSGAVAVRDSKNPEADRHVFAPHAWRSFLRAVRADQL